MSRNYIVVAILLISLYFGYNIYIAIIKLKEDKMNGISKKDVRFRFMKNLLLAAYNTLDFRFWF